MSKPNELDSTKFQDRKRETEKEFCSFAILQWIIHPPCSVHVSVLAVGEHSYCREKSFKKLIESQVFLRDEISSCASNLSAQLKLGFWWWQKTRLIDAISEDCDRQASSRVQGQGESGTRCWKKSQKWKTSSCRSNHNCNLEAVEKMQLNTFYDSYHFYNALGSQNSLGSKKILDLRNPVVSKFSWDL